MQFWITFRTGFRDAHYLVEYVLVNKREEQFKVIARNGSVTFSSNRPLFRNKGLRKRRPDYVLIEGSIPNKSTESQLVEAIQRYVERNLDG
jgi:TolB-like protein